MPTHKTMSRTALAITIGQMMLGAQASAATFSAGTQPNLINAINTANGTPEADSITITADISFGALSAGASNSLPMITSPITINGGGHKFSRAAGNNDSFRFIELASAGTLTLNQTTITGGSLSERGGAIRALPGSSLTINNSNLYGNSATGGGAVYIGSGNSNSIISYLTISGSTFTNNQAASGGGILASSTEADIRDSVVDNNYASFEAGGVFFSNYQGVSSTTLTLVDSQIRGNSAFRDGGGLFVETRTSNPSQVIIENCTISGNSAGLPGSPGFTGRGGGINAINTCAGMC
jgi:hypothetical protein